VIPLHNLGRARKHEIGTIPEPLCAISTPELMGGSVIHWPCQLVRALVASCAIILATSRTICTSAKEATHGR
jgi:hypothetical protein